MIDLTCDSTVYDNLIEYYFHEYFELRNIDISGLNFKTVPNNLYQGAFNYIYSKLFKPDNNTVKLNNKNTKIDLNNLDEIKLVYDSFKKLCLDYNILAFQKFFLNLTGISKDTINSWLRCEYNHNGLSQEYSDFAKNLNNFTQETTKNRLADDKIGIQSLANNDTDVGLLYARQDAYNKALGDTQARISLEELKKGLPMV